MKTINQKKTIYAVEKFDWNKEQGWGWATVYAGNSKRKAKKAWLASGENHEVIRWTETRKKNYVD